MTDDSDTDAQRKPAYAAWPMPPRLDKADGRPRRVGVEIELQGLELDSLADLVASTLGGTIDKASDANYLVDVPDIGEFRVELDYALLKKLADEREHNDESQAGIIGDATYEFLNSASSLVVPCEIVTPPIPVDNLAEPLERLVSNLREAGAKGTRNSPFFAFGVHLNVEPPDLEAVTIAAYLKAFVCLFDWIVEQGEIDFARRATPYIQRYPADYEMLLADPDYWPDMDRLIVDYLEYNATRNRALDMLPMLATLNAAAVDLTVDDDRVNARPAFHYRLANSMIDEPDWSVADPWSRWLQIEYLAGKREALDECCKAYRESRDRLMHRFDKRWNETVRQWLTNH